MGCLTSLPFSSLIPLLQSNHIQACIWISDVPLDSLPSSAWDKKESTLNSLFLNELTITPADYTPFFNDDKEAARTHARDEMYLFVIHFRSLPPYLEGMYVPG